MIAVPTILLKRPRVMLGPSHGFTLLELLAVLVILGLLAAFAAPRVINLLGGAKSDAAATQISNLGTILDLYRLEVGDYPTTEQGLEALVSQPPGVEAWNGPYINKASSLIDPWNRLYVYESPGDNAEYDLYTLGKDGAVGGEDEDADITSW